MDAGEISYKTALRWKVDGEVVVKRGGGIHTGVFVREDTLVAVLVTGSRNLLKLGSRIGAQ